MTHFPPPLMTSEPGSFAHATIVERKPQIIRQVIQDNDYLPEIIRALEAFREEIASQPMQPLRESAPDAAGWNEALAAYAGKTWLEVPWYFAETFFYRKLLEATRYYQVAAGQPVSAVRPNHAEQPVSAVRPNHAGQPVSAVRHDQNPFQKQKDKQVAGDIQRLAGEWDQFSALTAETLFEALLHSCLWGNRADLSNFTVKVKARSGLAAREERHLILIDHTEQVRDILSNGVRRVDFINDNVGSDLLFDLALADFLLGQGWAGEIHFHLKNQPFFVSDAMPEDVQQTVALLRAAPSAAMSALGARLAESLTTHRFFLEADPFWTSWQMFRQMPPRLQGDLAQADLVLLKGDVNFRRLLDDLHWPYTTRMEEVTTYFPAPFVTLRTLKGEIMVGLQPGQAEALQAEDPAWLINGKRGVIQLVRPGEARS
jgi:uncharacterized protein with ATP-grasp and redox domains